MEKSLMRLPMDIEKFMALAEKAQTVVVANMKKDEDYDDAPDEFIGTAMKHKQKCFYG